MESESPVATFVNGDLQKVLNGQHEAAENNNIGAELTSSEYQDRIIRKAKRRLKKSPSKELTLTSEEGFVNTTQKEKNLRRSRAGKGRGLPKKGGAGGKGTWGKAGEIYDEDDAECQDQNDPNYDSETQGDYKIKTVWPKLGGDDLVKVLEPIVKEFFEHGDTSEVAACLSDLNISDSHRHQVPTVAVTLALEKKANHKEMTSLLLSDLYGKKLLSEEELVIAFNHLLSNLSDLILDTPDAPSIVGQFIARAIADDCLPPKFLQLFKGQVDCEFSRKALDRADVLLSMKHGYARLDKVWGVSGGTRPVKLLSKRMILLLKEYLSSSDIEEATRCLQELEVPHFHHELVYEAVVIVLEEGKEKYFEMMVKFLKALMDSGIITTYQMNAGFERAFEALSDLVLDVPYAYQNMERFADLCVREKIMSAEMRIKVPTRGRKRFVSEGDGGRVKNHLGTSA